MNILYINRIESYQELENLKGQTDEKLDFDGWIPRGGILAMSSEVRNI